MAEPKKTRWYENGLRFKCTQCGNCCTSRGEHTYLYAMPEDVTAISGYLGMSEEAFLEEHCGEDQGWTIIQSEGSSCTFLDTEGRCSIYPVRPKQCSSWPFWEENLRKPIWENIVLSTCPGSGKGDLHSADEAERIAQENEDWYVRDE